MSAGVDWITVTAHETAIGRRLLLRAELWQSDAVSAGNYLREWRFGQYRGRGAGGVFSGVSELGVIVQCTGTAADRYWSELTKIGGRPSRLDAQVTIDSGDVPLDPATEAYNRSSTERQRGRQVSTKVLIQGTDGGKTCYLGAASSEHRMRVYDKGVESGERPAGLRWRYELQLRRQHAQHLARWLHAQVDPRSGLVSAVAGEATRRGVPVWFDAAVVPATPGLATRSDVDTSLDWLATSVAPCVRRLAARGEVMAVLEALGLQGQLEIRRGPNTGV